MESMLQKAIQAGERHGEVLAVRPYSFHPDDWYLWVVLVKKLTSMHQNLNDPQIEYATWLVNAEMKAYTCEGHYFADLNSALRNFNQRAYLNNQE